jgi:hypothetical protein
MNQEIILATGGIIYGMLLISVMFVRTAFTEKLRVDALIFPNPKENSRALNLVAGAAFAAYGIWSLIN